MENLRAGSHIPLHGDIVIWLEEAKVRTSSNITSNHEWAAAFASTSQILSDNSIIENIRGWIESGNAISTSMVSKASLLVREVSDLFTVTTSSSTISR